jgi:hypothetical protein
MSYIFRIVIFLTLCAHTCFILEVNFIFHNRLHKLRYVPYVPSLSTPLRLAPCLHLQIKSKQIMWARIITLQRTIHTPTLHGVTIRMCRIHKGSKEISNREITIKLHHKLSNQIQSERRITSKVLYSNL